MGEGTTFVIEQLGLTLKNMQDQYTQLLQHAQSLQKDLDDARAQKVEEKVTDTPSE